MENFRLKPTKGRNVKFKGRLLGSASDRGSNSTRWNEFALYHTAGGKWVCEIKGITMWEKEEDTCDVIVCQKIEDIFDVFGDDRIARELYEDANIEFAVNVD